VVELSTAEDEHVVFGASGDIDAQYVRVTWLDARRLRIAYPTREGIVATSTLDPGVTIRDEGWRDVSIVYANWP
jgi:hypothetical protein